MKKKIWISLFTFVTDFANKATQQEKLIQARDEIQIPLEIETLTTKSKWKIKTKQKFLNPYFLENQMSGERSQSS